MTDLRKAAKMALEIFDWLERRSMYQDLQMKETHDALRQALAQPNKEWVGLSEDDRSEIRRSGSYSVRDKDFQAIEDKLKEKNV